MVEDGRILFAAGEERFSRNKQHSGFPWQAIQAALRFTGTRLEAIDAVAYAFFEWDRELSLIGAGLAAEAELHRRGRRRDPRPLLAAARARIPERTNPIHGLRHPNQHMEKGLLKETFYRLAGATPRLSGLFARRSSRRWAAQAARDHRHWQHELEAGLRELGLLDKLRRFEHHVSHAANAYYASGLDRALVVTLDGYGSGLAGSISLGEGSSIRRLQDVPFPYSLGTFYEQVTSSLGFNPVRHAGKVVGLAAYGDPTILSPAILDRFEQGPDAFEMYESLNVYFSRHLASDFPMVDVAAAYQHVLEVVTSNFVRHWVTRTGANAIALSGGVTANVKMNQRLHEIDGIRDVFVYPNMGDGGCGTGLALHLTRTGTAAEPLADVYLGPSFTPAQIRAELEREGLSFSEPAEMPTELARRIHAGEVIARFDGRMEYGPRALGNRSILYHGREPEVNHWLNHRLGRTEFMPFAPVTLWEARDRCYRGVRGAEHTAQFMTITFDCTELMRESCPAAVHVDGTARPQLIRREVNPGYYDILAEYEKISGIPSIINTSFNMHEEPIVCSPRDAVRAFLRGNLDALAIGPYLVPRPDGSASTGDG